MGKGARSREKNFGKKEEFKLLQEKEQKTKKRNRVLITAISLVLVAAIATGGLVYAFVFGNGAYLRDKTVAKTENFTVDNAMMTYYFRSSYESAKASYGEYFEMFTGVDSTKSLKNQNYDEEQTWFEYFLTAAKTSVQKMLVMAEQAKADGLELTESDHKGIEAKVNATAGAYLTDGVSKDDVRKAMEIAFLSQKCINKFSADTKYTDTEVNTYYDENANTYKNASYRTYTVKYTEEATGTESSAAENSTAATYTKEQAKAKADELKAATSEDSFQALVKTLAAEQDTSLDEEALKSKVDGTLTEKAAYTADDATSEWVFDKARAVGDTYIKEDETGKQYTVIYLTAPAVRDESTTINTRHILLSLATYSTDEKAKAKAEEVLAEWQADPTEETFANLATEYSEDGGSSQNGGLYTAVTKGSMVAEFDDWCFDAARKSGDTDIVKTDYGYHVMYFVGNGGQVWQEKIIADMKTAAYDTKYAELSALYAVAFDDAELTNIPA